MIYPLKTRGTELPIHKRYWINSVVAAGGGQGGGFGRGGTIVAIGKVNVAAIANPVGCGPARVARSKTGEAAGNKQAVPYPVGAARRWLQLAALDLVV